MTCLPCSHSIRVDGWQRRVLQPLLGRWTTIRSAADPSLSLGRGRPHPTSISSFFMVSGLHMMFQGPVEGPAEHGRRTFDFQRNLVRSCSSLPRDVQHDIQRCCHPRKLTAQSYDTNLLTHALRALAQIFEACCHALDLVPMPFLAHALANVIHRREVTYLSLQDW